MSDFRKEVAKILVKWNMSTRQSAITEIVALHEKTVEGAKREIIEDVKRKSKAIHDYGKFLNYLEEKFINWNWSENDKTLSKNNDEDNPGWNEWDEDNENQW